jgi:hypothetical protein
LNGGSDYTYSWQGDLGFLEKDTVVLPRPDWNEVSGKTGEFWFELLDPNGQIDPTPHNNKRTSSFKMALKITRNEIQFYFKTNQDSLETTWKLYDINGNLLYENEPDMQANKVYIKDLSLANGSYKLCLYDSFDDGLSFMNSQTGSAYLRRMNVPTSALYRFETDFGRFAQLYFAVNKYSELATEMDAVEVKDFTVFPNPAHTFLYLDMSAIHGKNLSAEIHDLSGKKLITMPLPQLRVNKIGINYLSSGTYLIVIKEGNRQVAKNKFIVD